MVAAGEPAVIASTPAMGQPPTFLPSFGLVTGRPLFLDLSTDSYFLLETDAENELIAGLRDDPTASLQPVSWTPPYRELVSSARFAVRDILSVRRILKATKRNLASRPLCDVIGTIFSSRSAAGKPDFTILPVTFAQRFLAARRYLPGSPHCLTDSLALLGFLNQNGTAADLVFGAKLDPFAAHCWVEADGVLLNDHLDRIECFTPVGVVRS